MTDYFQMIYDDKRFLKFLKYSSRAFQYAAMNVMNDLAFEHRRQSMRQIGRDMIIRNPDIVRKVMKVEKAKVGPISTIQATSGSSRIQRHDAFKHTEEGTPIHGTRFMKAGRRGRISDVGWHRARSGKADIYEQDVKTKGSGDTRIIRYIQAISRDPSKAKKTWMLSRQYKSMPPGIYRFKGKFGKFKGRKGMTGKPTLLSITHNKEAAKRDIKKYSWNEKAAGNIKESYVMQAWTKRMTEQMRMFK